MVCANRRNIYRLIGDLQGVNGRDLREVAVQVVAALKLHPTATRKVQEILQVLLDEHRAVYQHGVLRLSTEQERLELIQRDRETERQRKLARRNSRGRQAYAAACRDERRRLMELTASV